MTDYTWEPELDRFIDTETGACTEWHTLSPRTDKQYKASFDLGTDMSRFIIVLVDHNDERVLVAQGLMTLDGVAFDAEPSGELMKTWRWFLAGQMYAQWMHTRARLLYIKAGGT